MTHSRADWLAHIDADEFLVQSSPLSAELAQIRDCELHFPVSERFYRDGTPPQTLFDGILRRPIKLPRAQANALFGPAAQFLSAGLIGHRGGKSAVPTGADFKLGIHTGYRGGRKPEHKVTRHSSTTTRLYHFDGLTPLHYLMKLARYARGRATGTFPKSRLAQIEAFTIARGDLAQMMEMHDLLRATSPAVETALRASGHIEPAPFQPTQPLRATLAQDLDLSVSGFDAALIARFPELYRDITG